MSPRAYSPSVESCLLYTSHPGQLLAGHGLEALDASRLPWVEADPALSAAITEGRLTAVNPGRAGWEALLAASPKEGKKRVNLLAIGDVGSTLLTGQMCIRDRSRAGSSCGPI